MQAGAGSDKEMEMSEIIRLDKYLADMGCGTRSQVKQMIRKGQVEINGEKIKKPEQKITTAQDRVCVAGKEIRYEKYRYYLLHKPAGYVFDAEGMLIEGFDQLSTMATIYNYPYYPQHMEKLGFEKDADWVEYKIYIPDAIPDKHKRISDLIQRKFNLKVKKYTSGKKIAAEYGQAIFELMNEAYAPLYGFSALSQGQINQYIKMYLPIVDLRMVTLVTDAEDKLVAVGISMPSLSEALRKAKGRLLPMGWYHLLKVLFLHKYPPMLDLLLVAVKPEYQNKGVNALLFSDLIPVYQQLGFKYAESNPELELNGKVQAQWEYFKTEQHKRRRAYKKSIL